MEATMINPLNGNKMKLRKETMDVEFRKEKFTIIRHYYKDEATGEEYVDEKLLELNLSQLYNQYRAKYRLPFPEEIKALREKYGLPANKMAEVLGFGVNIYRDYENGQVPSESNARLIQLAKDAKEFLKLVRLSQVFEDEEKKEKIEFIKKIIEKEEQLLFSFDVEQYIMGAELPDEYSGYKKGNLDKLRNMVIYFTKELKPFKTKLNKLLFFSDFLHFKETGYSMSGCRYRAIELGPVPINFNSALEHFCTENSIDIYITEFPTGAIGERFVPNENSNFKKELFSEAELTALDYIKEKFKDTPTQKMIDISHDEKGWLDNVEGHKKISYMYGWELKGI